jgi:hypothetical protein
MKTRRWLVAVALVLVVIQLSGCSSALLGYLVYDYLNDSAPKLWWRGKVTDSAGDPVAGLRVQVRAEVLGKDDVLNFSENTNEEGDYDIKFRWSSEVVYSLRVYDNDQVVKDHYIGKVNKEEQITDLTLDGVYNAEISGVVSSSTGATLQDVVVLAALTNDLETAPTFMRDSEDALVFDETNEGGVYDIQGRLLDYAIICVYHPDYGFAYAYAEDTDHDGSIGLNITMGGAGQHDVDVQVVNGLGLPIVNQVLATNQQFRVQMSQRWDFRDEMDEVVIDNGLFPGRNVTPSDQHPEKVIFAVQATNANGICQGEDNVPGGTYDLTLLRIGDDQLATALVNSDNPLALSEDALIVVRVN